MATATRQKKDRRFLKAAGVLAIVTAIALTPWLCGKWEKYKAASETQPTATQPVNEGCPECPSVKECPDDKKCFANEYMPKKDDGKCEENKGELVVGGEYSDPKSCRCRLIALDKLKCEEEDLIGCPDLCKKEETAEVPEDPTPQEADCGNRICEKGENQRNCSDDCKPCGRRTVSARYKKCDSDSDCAEGKKCNNRCKCVKKASQQQGTSTAKCNPGKVRLFKEHQVGQHATKAYLGINQVRNKQASNGEMINGKTVSAVVTHCTDGVVDVSKLSIPGAPADLVRKVKASIVRWVKKVPPENYDIKFKISLTVRD